MPLAMTSPEGPDGPILATISGRFDQTNQELLRSCVRLFAGDGRVVIDLSDTAFVDSTMLDVLAEATKSGVRLSVANAKPHVETILITSGLSTLLL